MLYKSHMTLCISINIVPHALVVRTIKTKQQLKRIINPAIVHATSMEGILKAHNFN